MIATQPMRGESTKQFGMWALAFTMPYLGGAIVVELFGSRLFENSEDEHKLLQNMEDTWDLYGDKESEIADDRLIDFVKSGFRRVLRRA